MHRWNILDPKDAKNQYMGSTWDNSEPVMNPLHTPHGFNYSFIRLDGVVPETKDWSNLNDSPLHGSDTWASGFCSLINVHFYLCRTQTWKIRVQSLHT